MQLATINWMSSSGAAVGARNELDQVERDALVGDRPRRSWTRIRPRRLSRQESRTGSASSCPPLSPAVRSGWRTASWRGGRSEPGAANLCLLARGCNRPTRVRPAELRKVDVGQRARAATRPVQGSSRGRNRREPIPSVPAKPAPPLQENRGDRTRTCDLRFWRPPLYQLSYAPVLGAIVALAQMLSQRHALGLLFLAIAPGLRRDRGRGRAGGRLGRRGHRGGARRLDGARCLCAS